MRLPIYSSQSPASYFVPCSCRIVRMTAIPALLATTVQSNITIPIIDTAAQAHPDIVLSEEQFGSLTSQSLDSTGRVLGPEDARTIVARPSFKRTDSSSEATAPPHTDLGGGQDSQPVESPIDLSIANSLHDTMVVSLEPNLQYPPHETTLATEGESTSIRRLRMSASFFALFLAGWK